MINRLKNKLRTLIASQIEPCHDDLFMQIDLMKFEVGQLQARLLRGQSITRLQEAEFKVFSQWGEDGIIQYLIRQVPMGDTSFIEIGVENYWESNTRFLLMNDNWRGLIVDGQDGHERFLEKSGLRWRYQIDPVTAFVNRDNINSIIAQASFGGDIGLLSIDIDGMDYWVLEALTVVSPRIWVVEYNPRFGLKRSVTVPYDPAFSRTQAHYSNCYYGASLPAFCRLAESRGYQLVGIASSGNNAFFVRRDVCPEGWPRLELRDIQLPRLPREARNAEGSFSYLSSKQELELLADMKVFDFDINQLLNIRSLD